MIEHAAEPGTADRYRSIFLADDWVHQQYFGWSVARQAPGVRVLEKRRGPVRRALILLTRAGEKGLPDAMRGVTRGLALADIYIHDFDGLLSVAPSFSGRSFVRLGRGQTLLNTATYVVDLAASTETIFANVSASSRNKIRKAEADGAYFVVSGGERAILDAFYAFFVPMARERQFHVPDRAVLEEMEGEGRAIVTACADRDGQFVATSVMYRCDKTAYSLHSAHARRGISGSGQFLHWRNMLHVRDLGCRWYDFGGVADPNTVDGIHAFKKSMGGALTLLGAEYRGAGAIVRALERLATHVSPS
jgi:hypothetical protein